MKIKNILVTGAKGLLAQEFKEKFKNFSQFNVHYADKNECNITDISQIRSYVHGKNIDIIINCAANRNAEKMEEDECGARLITVQGPKNLAIVANEIDATLIHFSSDYVFDGTQSRPYKETDKTRGLSVYGRLKIEGEKAVLETANTAIIIRTAWLFSSYGQDFVKTIKHLAEDKDELRVIFDQVGSPCYAGDLALYTIQMLSQINKGTKEIYHVTNEGVCSWFDLAYNVVEALGYKCRVIPIHTEEFVQKAQRPHYSVLDKAKFKNDFGVQIRHYREGLQECLQKIAEKEKCQ